MTEQAKQQMYRDARYTDKYDQIWQSVGKCVFCDMREKYIFFEENGVVMTISLFAYVDGQFMIVPRRHVTSAKQLSELEWETMRKFMYIAKKLVRTVHGIKGMQFILREGQGAQSTVGHLHMQCIPFDAPDLSVWNYRKLKNTPMQNVALYIKEAKEVIKTGQKFEQKYSNSSSLAVVCDAVIINDNNEILFEDRADQDKLVPDYITLPGGIVTDFSKTLVSELAREVHEETGYSLDVGDLTLISSQIDSVARNKVSKSLQASYTSSQQFIRNSYLLRIDTPKKHFKAGDDAKRIVWIALTDIGGHKNISPETKDIIGMISP